MSKSRRRGLLYKDYNLNHDRVVNVAPAKFNMYHTRGGTNQNFTKIYQV